MKTRRKTSKRPPLIDRTLTDDNFAHTLSMLGACAAFCEALKPGQRVSWNDLNMITIPVELALAFAKSKIGEQSPYGEAAHKAFETLALFRGIHEPHEENKTGSEMATNTPE